MKEWKIGSIKLFGDVYEIFIGIGWFLMAGFLVYQMAIYASENLGIAPGSSKGLLFGLIVMSLVYGSLLVHEFCHAIVGNKIGLKIGKIKFFALGMAAILEKSPEKPNQEFKMAVVGPLSNFIIFGFLIVLKEYWQPASIYFAHLIKLLMGANLAIGVFNLLPIFPMDGGRVIRSIAWGLAKDKLSATRFAVFVSYFLSVAMFGFGIYSGFYMLIIFAVVLVLMAPGELIMLEQEKKLSAFTVKDLMVYASDEDKEYLKSTFPLIKKYPLNLPLDEAARIMEAEKVGMLLIAEGNEIIGVVSLSGIYEKLRELEKKK